MPLLQCEVQTASVLVVNLKLISEIVSLSFAFSLRFFATKCYVNNTSCHFMQGLFSSASSLDLHENTKELR